MRKKLTIAALTLALTTVGSHQVMAADATAGADLNSAYVWRGLTFNDGLVLQPYMDVAAGGFAFNVWGNFDLDDYDDAVESGEFSEVDLTLSYSHTFGSVDTSIGVIEYLFPAGGDSTTELFITGGMDFGAGFSGALELYYDIDQVEDYYITASIGYGYDFNEQTALELGGLISYAGEDFAAFYAGGTDSGFFNYLLSATLSYSPAENWSVGASINFSDSLDDDALPDEAVDVNVFGGISVSYSF